MTDEYSLDDIEKDDWHIAGDKPNPRTRVTKYNAKPTVIDGYRFDSKAESRHYLYLRGELEAGYIADLEPRPKPIILIDPFIDNEGALVRAITYKPDFMYTHVATGLTVIEDVKGGKATQTQLFRLKWKLLKLKYREDKTFKLRIVES